MEHLISVSREVYNFPNIKNIPVECKESIFIPAFSVDCQHHYFLVDFNNKRITCWNVDLKPIKEVFKRRIDPSTIEVIPWNMDLDTFLNGIFFAHSADYYNGKIYISYIDSNFILALDVNSDSYKVIYDRSNGGLTKIYSSTNMLKDGNIYFTRWKIEDCFKHSKYNDFLVELEIGRYSIENDDFEIIDKFKGPDDIHTTMITHDNKHLLILEMSQNPVIPFPKNMEDITLEQSLKILEHGLQPSTLITYDLENKKLNKLVLPAGPAHIETDPKEKDVFYISSHNLCSNKDTLYCFGRAYVDKLKIMDGGSEIIGHYKDDDLYRAPSHKVFMYDNKRLMATTVFPNQLHIFDWDNMKVLKKIKLRKSLSLAIDFSQGPFKYPPAMEDKTPYSVNVVDEKEYMYLSSLWNITVFDFINEKKISSLIFNKNKALIAMGHANKFAL